MVTRFLLIECLGADKAQPYVRSALSCHVLSSPVDVRSEGLAERVGDLRLFFSLDRAAALTVMRGPADAAPLLVDLDVELNTDIIWHGGTGPILLSETEWHVIRKRGGRRLDRNRVRFEGVPIESPARITITNIRADAFRFGIINPINSSHPITAKVRARDGFRDVTIEDVEVTLAFLHGSALGFRFEPPYPLNVSHAEILGEDLRDGLTKTASPTFTLYFIENFGGAFKSREEEAGITALPPDEVADSGTLLTLALRGIPEGVAVYVGVTDRLDRPAVRLIQGRRSLERGGDLPGSVVASRSGVELVQLDVTDHLAEAVWEWMSTEPVMLDSGRKVALDILVVAASSAVGLPATIVATVMLSPQRIYSANTDSLPVPCFGYGAHLSPFNLLSIG